jgi:D-alanyl-lipoteichoic acid acyltransferase DltB (MBOAT superfamily)
LPHFDDTFLGYIGGARYPRYLCWASLVTYFVEDVLNMAVWGGAIVACARMAGFRLLRNTYRPLEATTLAEFWNRYYFYYKELLVDHFFYPVFLRYFRANRKLRMFFATFMAACVGNLLFHFIRDIRFVAELGWWKAVSGEASHAFYTLLLAIGVGVSQMRTHNRERSKGSLRGRILPCVWVMLFFCVLHVFDAPLDRVHSIWQRADFLSYLMGINTWI